MTTLAATLGDGPPQYALEGSVFVAGAAVQWFRDGLKAVGAAPEIDVLYGSASDDSEVLFVPALTGLGAPHWQPEARGTIFGLTRATTVADLARATLEGIAFQVADLIDAINADLPQPLSDLRVDGGMARSEPFLQFQADLLGLPLRRSPETESTAPGRGPARGPGLGLLARLPARLHPRSPPVGQPDLHRRPRPCLAVDHPPALAARRRDGPEPLSRRWLVSRRPVTIR